MKKPICLFAALIALTLNMACAAPAAEPKPEQLPPETRQPIGEESSLTPKTVEEARSIVFRAELEELGKMSPADIIHNKAIRAALHEERVTVLTAGLPAWTRDAFTKFEGEEGEHDAAYSRSIAWGTGSYAGRQFDWFAHTNSDGWLQVSLSAALSEKDVDLIYGRKPGDLEREATNPDRKIEVFVPKGDEEGFPISIAKTRIGLDEEVDWTEEFCEKKDSTSCNTVAAFEKYLLPAANGALPHLKFTMKGKFPTR